MRREAGARPQVAAATSIVAMSSSLRQTHNYNAAGWHCSRALQCSAYRNALCGGMTNSSPPEHRQRAQKHTGDGILRPAPNDSQQTAAPISRVLHSSDAFSIAVCRKGCQLPLLNSAAESKFPTNCGHSGMTRSPQGAGTAQDNFGRCQSSETARRTHCAQCAMAGSAVPDSTFWRFGLFLLLLLSEK